MRFAVVRNKFYLKPLKLLSLYAQRGRFLYRFYLLQLQATREQNTISKKIK